MRRLLLVFMLLATPAFADDTPLIIDLSSLDSSQHKFVKPAIFRIIAKRNGLVKSILGADGSYTLVDPTFDVSTISSANVLAQVREIEVERADTIATKEALRNEYEALGIDVTTSYMTWDTMTTAQKLVVLKKVVRREVIRQMQEIA